MFSLLMVPPYVIATLNTAKIDKIIRKTIKVIDSCETEKQIITASHYGFLACKEIMRCQVGSNASGKIIALLRSKAEIKIKELSKNDQ